MIVNFQSMDLSQLEELAWKELQTVVVLGPVSRAVWWPPNGKIPGVLGAGSIEQVRETLERILIETGRQSQEIGFVQPAYSAPAKNAGNSFKNPEK